jgi:hypothetical protein
MMARLSLPTSFGHQKEVGWATKLNHSQKWLIRHYAVDECKYIGFSVYIYL